MKDGAKIKVNKWLPDEEVPVKGVLVLHHGLAEHSMRYDRFGSVLSENGYILIAHDVRGHGGNTHHPHREDVRGRGGNTHRHHRDDANDRIQDKCPHLEGVHQQICFQSP